MSYYEPSQKMIYLAAVMEVERQTSRESWKVRGADQQKMKEEIIERFRDARVRCLGQMIQEVRELCFYPIRKLGPSGKWSRGKVMLLGDAAHAVGESCNSSHAPHCMTTTKGHNRCPRRVKALASLLKTLSCSHIYCLVTPLPTHSANMNVSANRASISPTLKRIVDLRPSKMWAGCSVRFCNGSHPGSFGGHGKREEAFAVDVRTLE